MAFLIITFDQIGGIARPISCMKKFVVLLLVVAGLAFVAPLTARAGVHFAFGFPLPLPFPVFYGPAYYGAGPSYYGAPYYGYGYGYGYPGAYFYGRYGPYWRHRYYYRHPYYRHWNR
jgi:hypothetical protein